MSALEELKEQLRKEGFVSVYDWRDEPGVTYPPHKHKGRVSMYVVEGEVTMTFSDKEIRLKAGDRFDVPVGQEHKATVGKDGCVYVVGEEIEGDS